MSSSQCDPRDIAIKSFFLGPQAENADWLRTRWMDIIDQWIEWRKSRFPNDGPAISAADQKTVEFQTALARTDAAVEKLLKALEQETIKFSPRYIGHMVSEVGLPAVLGHVCALLHNPNNTSREVSRVTSVFEEEAIHDLAEMIGFSSSAGGHFTSGGTLANFEALWRATLRLDARLKISAGGSSLLELGPWEFARQYKQYTGREFMGPVVLAPGNKHFSWEKGVSLFGFGADAFWTIALDREGRLDIADLNSKISAAHAQNRPILMVVSVAGTTEMGEVDPIEGVQSLLDRMPTNERPWHHIDAAYGGYFCTMLNRTKSNEDQEIEATLTPQVVRSLKAISRADSVTLDPHKLGYVPYACGAFIAADQQRYKGFEFNAAYLDKKNDSHWMNTIEGSRSGAGATATWLSNKCLGLNPQGYGRLLAKGIEARIQMARVLKEKVKDIVIVTPTDTNVICFTVGARSQGLSDANLKAEFLYEWLSRSPNFAASRTRLSQASYDKLIHRIAEEQSWKIDADHLTLVRLVLMNPFITSKETKTHFIEKFEDEICLALASVPNPNI